MRLSRVLAWVALGCVLVAGMSAGAAQKPLNQVHTLTPSLTITPTPSPAVGLTLTAQAPVEIMFEGVYSLALDFRQPLRDVLDAHRDLLPERQYTVSAYRDTPGWAKITLVPSRFVENGWSDVEQILPLEVIMQQDEQGNWRGVLVGSAAFAAAVNAIPPAFADFVSPLPAGTSGYKFPWRSGEDWWAIQGWHDGNAVDFQPAFTARFGVLTAQAGRLRELCSDGSQSLLQIQHADGQATYYLHVTVGMAVRRHLLDQNIAQGQYLGELFRQRTYVTPCGQGYSRHLHFAVSDRRLTLDGYPLEGVAASASCCNHPPAYRSTNVRVNAHETS